MTAITCPKITAALHDVMVKCAYVQKSGQNKFHNYRYAGEADLLAVLRPAMVEAGLLLLPSVTQAVGPDEYGNTTVRIEYTLAHKDGEVWPEKIVAMGCGNDKNSKGGIGDKGTYKAITGANKYLLFKLFQIETGDDPETDERDVEPPARSQAAANRPPAKPEATADDAKAIAARIKRDIDAADSIEDLNVLMRNVGFRPGADLPSTGSDLAKVRHDSVQAYTFLIQRADNRRSAFYPAAAE